jgi:AraC-like DNA-binding protein
VPTEGHRADLPDRLLGDLLTKRAAHEFVPLEPGESFRFHVHDYPSPIARWNYHPEFELHFITHDTGRCIVGDQVATYGPGQLVLVGSNVPHHWVSDAAGSDTILGRDIVVQFRREWVDRCVQVLPEMARLPALLARARCAVEFAGGTAEQARRLLRQMRESSRTGRLGQFLEILDVLTNAPEDDLLVMGDSGLDPQTDPRTADVINAAMDYIFANINGEVRMSVAASLAGMSESAFSRYFRRASGRTFSDMVRQLRLARACYLLEVTTTPIAVIADEVGYANLSNFNRQFRAEYQRTPREFRRRVRHRASASTLDASS